MKKYTDDLQNELISSPDLGRFLSDKQDEFLSHNFSDLLQNLFQKKGISKAALAKNAGMSNVYLYQIFTGGRKPSRNRIICLCFGLTATLEETQTLLKESGNAQLYVRDRRDAIIIYGLTHDMPLSEINDKLFAEHEATLY